MNPTEDKAREVFASMLARYRKEHRARAYRNAIAQVVDLAERRFIEVFPSINPDTSRDPEAQAAIVAEMCLAVRVLDWMKP